MVISFYLLFFADLRNRLEASELECQRVSDNLEQMTAQKMALERDVAIVRKVSRLWADDVILADDDILAEDDKMGPDDDISWPDDDTDDDIWLAGDDIGAD